MRPFGHTPRAPPSPRSAVPWGLDLCACVPGVPVSPGCLQPLRARVLVAGSANPRLRPGGACQGRWGLGPSLLRPFFGCPSFSRSPSFFGFRGAPAPARPGWRPPGRAVGFALHAPWPLCALPSGVPRVPPCPQCRRARPCPRGLHFRGLGGALDECPRPQRVPLGGLGLGFWLIFLKLWPSLGGGRRRLPPPPPCGGRACVPFFSVSLARLTF